MNTDLFENLRKRKKLTQKEFAESIDLTVTGYQKMIKTGDLKVSSLERICEVFNVNISTFFGKSTAVVNEPPGTYNTEKRVFDLSSDELVLIDLGNKKLEIVKK